MHVGGFIVAVAGTMATIGLTTATALATLLSAVAVLLSVLVPIPIPRDDVKSYLSIIAAVVLFSVSVGVTGGPSSAFIIMPLASIFLAAIGGGVRAAIPTALLSIGGVLIGWWASGDNPTADAVFSITAIYAITAIAFSEVQRALMSEAERLNDLMLASQTSQGRKERLEATHDLLEDLLAVANSPDVNAVAAAQDALRDIAIVVPSMPSRIVGNGNVNLARRGTTPDTPPTEQFAIERKGVELARLDLWLESVDLMPSQRSAIHASVVPVGLALENDAMVQRLAGLTIQRERVRLARELHDDIAPSIASVGLALDMVLVAGGLTSDQERTLGATRSNVTRLVDRIRDRVQDLRADRSVSLVELANTLVAEIDADGPSVVVDLDERTPPRPAIAVEIGALVTESFRNAVEHSEATLISIAGRIDEGAGTVTISDNGVGFDPLSPAQRRFGLLGMQERAGIVGAELTIDSQEGGGTTVTVTWKDAR
jgi:signal transduction histidine kinase